MSYPTPQQWKALNDQLSPHARYFHELRRRLAAIGLRENDPYVMALDRVCDSVGSLMIHTHYAVCAKGEMQGHDERGPEWWVADGI